MRWHRPIKQGNPWQSWFAWRPVRIGEHLVWLEYVLRRSNDDPYSIGWEYSNGNL
jgi:hypothetical protein